MKNRKTLNIHNGNEQTVQISDVGENIVLAAIARNPFFRFSSLKRYFPHISSIHEFITSKSYLGGPEISFRGNKQLEAEDKLNAYITLLSKIEKEIRSKHTDHEGTRHFNRKRSKELIDELDRSLEDKAA